MRLFIGGIFNLHTPNQAKGTCDMLIAIILLTAITLHTTTHLLDDGVRFIDVDIRAERDRAIREGDIRRALKAQERLMSR